MVRFTALCASRYACDDHLVFEGTTRPSWHFDIHTGRHLNTACHEDTTIEAHSALGVVSMQDTPSSLSGRTHRQSYDQKKKK